MKEYLIELSKHKLFYNICENELTEMLNCLGAYIKKYKKGQFISFSGDSLRCIGIVIKGTVHMIKEDVWGNKDLFDIMRANDVFGESFICNHNFVANVSFYASEDSTILFLPFERVLKACSVACVYHHKLIENMVALIAFKNIQFMGKIEVLSKKTLRQKILTYLSQQAQISGDKYFSCPMGRMDMADYLCADRSALSRELSCMKKAGMLDYNKNTFKLLRYDE